MTRAHGPTRVPRPGLSIKRHPGAIVAVVAASIWLLMLTGSNLLTQGSLRSTWLFAIPVCIAAWHRWQAGFLFAALAVLCAWLGGAMPEPGSTHPLWLDALAAFAKLSIDALVAFAWGRRVRTRTLDKRASGATDSLD